MWHLVLTAISPTICPWGFSLPFLLRSWPVLALCRPRCSALGLDPDLPLPVPHLALPFPWFPPRHWGKAWPSEGTLNLDVLLKGRKRERKQWWPPALLLLFLSSLDHPSVLSLVWTRDPLESEEWRLNPAPVSWETLLYNSRPQLSHLQNETIIPATALQWGASEPLCGMCSKNFTSLW